MKQFRVALVGTGRHGRGPLLHALQAVPRLQVVALCDPDANARDAAQRSAPRSSVHANPAKLLEECPGLDAVVVCVPPPQLAAVGRHFLERGLPVYLEKPCGANATEVRALAQWASAIGARCQAGFCYRFHPLTQEIRRHRIESVNAPVRFVRIRFFGRNTGAGWCDAVATGGSLAVNLGSHAVDLARYLSGVEVMDLKPHARGGADPEVFAGALSGGGTVEIELSYQLPESFSIEVSGPDGGWSADLWVHSRPMRLRSSAASGLGWLASAAHASFPRWPKANGASPALKSAMQHFANFIEGNTAGHPTLDDAAAALEALELASEGRES